MKPVSFKTYILPLLLTLLTAFPACISCKRPAPIPESKKAFIGLWAAASGFKMEIKSSGTADVFEQNISSDPDNDTLIIGVTQEYAENMLVEFGGDSLLIIKQPWVRAREYHINRNPFMEGDTCKIILNGVVLVKQK